MSAERLAVRTMAPLLLAFGTAVTAACSTPVAAAAEDIVLRPDVVFVEADGAALHLDLALPEDAGDELRPAIVYVHGGAFRAGSRTDGRELIERYARGGYVAASVDYRLVDRASYPAIVGDVEDAVRYLRRHAAEHRIDPERIGIVGHAAGACLAAHVALTAAPGNPEFGAGADAVSSSVACAAGFSTPADFTDAGLPEASRGVIDAYLGHVQGPLRDAKARGASPRAWVDAGDPPIMLVHGTADELVPYAQAVALHAALREAGVECELVAVEGAGHRFRDADAERRVAAFFDRHLGGRAAEVEWTDEGAGAESP